MNKFSRTILLFFFGILFVFSVNGQDIEACSYIDNLPRESPLGDKARERMMTLCIEANKKEFKKLIDNSEQVAKLSKEIEDSYTENNKLSLEDQKKLKKVEKLLKKIRKELRVKGFGDDEDDDKPESTTQAIKDLQKKTTNFLFEIRKTTRHSISVAAIKSSNAVLIIVKFLRFKK